MYVGMGSRPGYLPSCYCSPATFLANCKFHDVEPEVLIITFGGFGLGRETGLYQEFSCLEILRYLI